MNHTYNQIRPLITLLWSINILGVTFNIVYPDHRTEVENWNANLKMDKELRTYLIGKCRDWMLPEEIEAPHH